MIPNQTQNTPTSIISTTIIRQNGIHTPINDSYSEKKQITTQYTKSWTQTCPDIKGKRPNCYLSVEKIGKMLQRFFNETQISKEALAESLGISIKSLNWLYLQKATPALIRKINLPLIHLYCKTRFSNQN